MSKLEKAARFAINYADEFHRYTHELLEEFKYNSENEKLKLAEVRLAERSITIPDGASPGVFYALGSYKIANGELVFIFDGKLPHKVANTGDSETYRIGDMLSELTKSNKGVIEAGFIRNPINRIDSSLKTVSFVDVPPTNLSLLMFGHIEVDTICYKMDEIFKDVGLTLKVENK